MLLSNPEFETTYKQVGPRNQIVAGLAPFNISIPGIPEETQGLFTYYTHCFLSNPQLAAAVDPPVNQPNHLSYIIPGPLWKVSITDLENEVITPLDLTDQQRDDANAYLVVGAPGYRLDYSPIETEEIFDNQTDCRVYDDSLQICVKNSDDRNLIAGTSPFSSNVFYECLR